MCGLAAVKTVLSFLDTVRIYKQVDEITKDHNMLYCGINVVDDGGKGEN